MGSVSVTRMESERNSVTEKPGDYQNGWSRCLPTMVYPLIVVFASVLGSLVVAELLLRGCNYYPSLQSGWVLKAPSARVPNRDVLLIPPKFLRASFYKTNPAHRTIVMLGDSFTESFPVKKQDSYPAILEGILTQQGIPTQVINAGIGDSGPDQHSGSCSNTSHPDFVPQSSSGRCTQTTFPTTISGRYTTLIRVNCRLWTAFLTGSTSVKSCIYGRHCHKGLSSTATSTEA